MSLSAGEIFDVKGLVAVITGGGTGIGLMMAKALEENGARVYIIGRRSELLEKVSKEEAKHGNLIPLAGDVTSKPDLQRIVSHIQREVGYINLLVANAGIRGPVVRGVSLFGPQQSSLNDVQKALWDVDEQELNSTLSVNVTSVYYTIVAFLSLLQAGNEKGNVAQTAQVITIGSAAAYNRITQAAHYGYCASKIGVAHMTKQFATMLAKYQIRCNVIAPGLYPSEITKEYFDNEHLMPPEAKAMISPLLRAGRTEDIAGIILWLASKAGGWIDGNVVISDGGKLCVVPAVY